MSAVEEAACGGVVALPCLDGLVGVALVVRGPEERQARLLHGVCSQAIAQAMRSFAGFPGTDARAQGGANPV